LLLSLVPSSGVKLSFTCFDSVCVYFPQTENFVMYLYILLERVHLHNRFSANRKSSKVRATAMLFMYRPNVSATPSRPRRDLKPSRPRLANVGLETSLHHWFLSPICGLKLSLATENQSQFAPFVQRLTATSSHATHLQFRINLCTREERIRRKCKQ